MGSVNSLAADAGCVVLVEDDPIIAATLSWLLRENGYSVAPVTDCDELFASIARTVPDLILLDCDAVGDAPAVFRRLRGDHRWNDVRVIATAEWTNNGNGTTLPWGADDCVTKPFRVNELLSRVRTQLRAGEQLRTTQASLREATAELERARGDAVNNRRLVDILHDVTSELSASGIYRVLTRRVAHALSISHCSVVIARPEDRTGVVVAAIEDATVHDVEIQIDHYPEIRSALDSGGPSSSRTFGATRCSRSAASNGRAIARSSRFSPSPPFRFRSIVRTAACCSCVRSSGNAASRRTTSLFPTS